MILAISQKDDYHVSFLLERLTPSRRKKVVQFRTEEFPSRSDISIQNFEIGCLTTQEGKYQLGNFSSAWYRRPAKPVIPDEVTSNPVRRYAQDECWQSLLDIWEWMSGSCLWVSNPSSIRRAAFKTNQLKVASEVGFKCPLTMITNNPTEAKKFLRSVGGHGIVKAIHKGSFQVGESWKMVYTNRINSDDPRLEDVTLAPAIFQEYVPKDVELRITVIGSKILACAIGSQVSEKTKDDWRHYDPKITPHYPFILPEQMKFYCLELVRRFGLQFGAIDLILTPAGEYVFLEINPNGQWAWIEEASGLPIAETLANLLFSREMDE